MWNSSGKSQKPLYTTLENYPEAQDKSPNSILRQLPSYTSTKVVSGVSSTGGTFSIWWIVWRNLVIIADNIVSAMISTGDWQLSMKTERQNIRKVNSFKMSKQMK